MGKNWLFVVPLMLGAAITARAAEVIAPALTGPTTATSAGSPESAPAAVMPPLLAAPPYYPSRVPPVYRTAPVARPAPVRPASYSPAPVAGPSAPVAEAPCDACAGACHGSLCQKLIAWATYCPQRTPCCGKCGPGSCCHCFPPLYAFFCEGCAEGGGHSACGAGCGTKGSCGLLTCRHRLFPLGCGTGCCPAQ